jgi:hypothetical protein
MNPTPADVNPSNQKSRKISGDLMILLILGAFAAVVAWMIFNQASH